MIAKPTEQSVCQRIAKWEKMAGARRGYGGRISINSRARRPAAQSKKIREIENRNSSIIINNLHLSLPFYYRSITVYHRQVIENM